VKTKGQTENTRFVLSVGRALRRAAKTARKTARCMGRRSTCGKTARWWRRNRDLSSCLLRSPVLRT